MPEPDVMERVRADRRAGKSPSTQAGEFVREEMHHVREGKHGAANTKQIIAIGLSKARRAGVKLPPRRRGNLTGKTKSAARSASKSGPKRTSRKPNVNRSRGISRALRHMGTKSASHTAVSRQARSAAKHRSPANRSAAAKKAAHTKKQRSR